MAGHISIHEQIGEKIELAGVYLDDGAPRSAARILIECAAILNEHADECDQYLRGADLPVPPDDRAERARTASPSFNQGEG